jgi:Mg/Co/Ni transporter MgtE
MIDTAGGEGARVFLRRFAVDLVAGACLGVASGLVALGLLQAMHEPMAVSAALSLAVGTTVLALAFVGAVLPPLLRRPTGRWRASSTLVTALMGAGGVLLFMYTTVILQNAIGK